MPLSATRFTKLVAVTSIAVAAMTAAGATPAAAADRSQDSVTVSGHGSVKGTPDTMIANMDAHHTAANSSDALDGASQVASNVIDALEANGVDAKDIQTSGVSVGPIYGKGNTVTSYRADETITARMHPLSTAQNALDAASKAGGNELDINSTYLTIGNKAPYERRARAKAFANAKAAAEQYAELAGRRLGRVMHIDATSNGPGVVRYPYPSAGASGGGGTAGGGSVPISPGTQTVSAHVRVVWALR